jgi:hypothetical protein
MPSGTRVARGLYSNPAVPEAEEQMAYMDTASWYDDEDDDNLTTFLPPKAALPVRARAEGPLAADWRRDLERGESWRAPESGTRRRPVPLPRALPARPPRRSFAQPAQVAPREPIFVPALLSLLGAVFVVAMLLGRIPHLH